ncbi:AI-2E family transporter [uncultured archaeon]|nr:AI-2E family transporter [uncultured archaeon]
MRSYSACIPGQSEWLPFIVIALLILLSYFIWPLLDGLVLGLVFAYVGRTVRNLFGENRRMGSLAATVCIVVPLSIVFSAGLIEAASQIRWLETHQGEIISNSYNFISQVHVPQVIFDEISRGMANLMEIILHLLTSLPVFSLGSAITMGIVNFLISLCVCYFLLLNGDSLLDGLLGILNLDGRELEARCLARIDSILSGVYTGSIYTAIVGGITSAAIFYLFGVPRPFAMASIVFLAGMVPFLTWLVFIPTAISRYVEFGIMDAFFFFLAASILVHLAELVIRPYIVSTKSSIHPLLVLLSFLGGGLVAGVSGFFMAPAMVAVVTGIYQVVAEDREQRNALAIKASSEQKS